MLLKKLKRNYIWKVYKSLITIGDFKKTKKKFTWLATSSNENSPIEVLLYDYDYLITKKKLEADDKFEDFVSPKTEFVTSCFGDKNISKLKKGDIIQLERKGYI